MLEHNLAAIRCDSYEIFAGVYPNDPETEAAVRSVAQSFANVHLAPVPHDGPTSKADCLNWAFQHLLIEEESRGAQFDIVIVHDAEDLIHPEELRWMNYYSARFDFIQTPVLPLPTPFRALAHGLYCGDFAWNHTCDMTVRPRFGGFVPARAWARASGATLWKNSPPLSKTASSTRRRSPRTTRMVMFWLGCRQAFVPLFRSRHAKDFVATREYFPKTWRTALRQRSRWVTGIALQGWKQFGWGATASEI